MNELEGLYIYKQYMDLIYYTHFILLKYPKIERFSLVTDIKKTTYSGMKKIIYANKACDKRERLKILHKMDVNLKMLKIFIRLSYKNKYINGNNYGAWSRKITNVSNLLGGWIKSCR